MLKSMIAQSLFLTAYLGVRGEDWRGGGGMGNGGGKDGEGGGEIHKYHTSQTQMTRLCQTFDTSNDSRLHR